jgi:hypothetical protein
VAKDEFSISGITSSKVSDDLSEIQIVLETGEGKRRIGYSGHSGAANDLSF